MIAYPNQQKRIWLARLFIIAAVLFMLTPVTYLGYQSITFDDYFGQRTALATHSTNAWRQLIGQAIVSKRSGSVYFRLGDIDVQDIGIDDALSVSLAPDGQLIVSPVEPWVLNYPAIDLRFFALGLSNTSKDTVRGNTLTVHVGSSNQQPTELDVNASGKHFVSGYLPMPAFSNEVDRIQVFYEYLWFEPSFATFTRTVLTNSLKLATSASVAVVFMSLLLAYALVRLKIAFKTPLTGLVLVAQMFPSFLLITTYSNVFYWMGEYVSWLGRDSFYSVFAIYLGSITLSVFLLLGFFKQVDTDMEESAFIDGATPFQALWHILLPMSRPIIAVTFMVAFVFFYSEFNISNRMLTADNLTFAAFIMDENFYQSSPSLQSAMLLVSCIPVMILFLLIRRHVVSGLAEGSTKG